MSPAPSVAPVRTGRAGHGRTDGSPPSRIRSGAGGQVRAVLRVHRAALWLWGIFVSFAVVAFVYLDRLGRVVERAKVPDCSGASGPVPPGCGPGYMDAHSFYHSLLEIAAFGFTVLPFVIAVWAGGALVAREFELGTHALAWTQSVTPARWLLTKIALPAGLIAVSTAGLSLLFRRVWLSSAGIWTPVWHEADSFLAAGTTGTGYALLGLAVGVFAGVLTRRTLPAMGLAFGSLLAVLLAGETYRFDLWPKVRLTGEKASALPDDAYQADLGMITDSGRTVDDLWCFDADLPGELAKCLAKHDGRDIFAVIHPESHFWPLQLVETGIVLGLAALFTAAAFRLLHRRTP